MNGPISPASGVSNFGFPCTQADAQIPPFNAPALTPTPPVCTEMAANRSLYREPQWAFHHPGTPAVFSALAYHPIEDRWYLGDAVRALVFSISASNATGVTEAANATAALLRTEKAGAYPVHLLYLADVDGSGTPGMAYVDIGLGVIESLPPAASPSPSPSPSPLAPVVSAAGGSPALLLPSLLAVAAATVVAAANGAW